MESWDLGTDGTFRFSEKIIAATKGSHNAIENVSAVPESPRVPSPSPEPDADSSDSAWGEECAVDFGIGRSERTIETQKTRSGTAKSRCRAEAPGYVKREADAGLKPGATWSRGGRFFCRGGRSLGRRWLVRLCAGVLARRGSNR